MMTRKAGTAQDGSAEVRQKRNRGTAATVSAGYAGFDARSCIRVCVFCPALLAVRRSVLEMFVPKEELFACTENKVFPAIDAFQFSVDEFHIQPHRET